MRVVVNCGRCQANVLVLEGVDPGVGGLPDSRSLSLVCRRHGWQNTAIGAICTDCQARPAAAAPVDLPKAKRKKTGGEG